MGLLLVCFVKCYSRLFRAVSQLFISDYFFWFLDLPNKSLFFLIKKRNLFWSHSSWIQQDGDLVGSTLSGSSLTVLLHSSSAFLVLLIVLFSGWKSVCGLWDPVLPQTSFVSFWTSAGEKQWRFFYFISSSSSSDTVLVLILLIFTDLLICLYFLLWPVDVMKWNRLCGLTLARNLDLKNRFLSSLV